jgi:hypothetical protein
MLIETLASTGIGAGVALALAPWAEWAVHKYLLHASPRMRQKVRFIENASRGHNDNHHGAYRGPDHYYRDSTNEDETIHFALSDVGVIGLFALATGAGVSAIHNVATQKGHFDGRDLALVGGTVLGTMAYYGAHVIGDRRMHILQTLGDTIQGGAIERDGMLRFSKPILDDICNSIEYVVDKGGAVHERVGAETIAIFQKQIEENAIRKKQGKLGPARVATDNVGAIIGQVVTETNERERTYREKLTGLGRIAYAVQRVAGRRMRDSRVFQYMDDHHFLHHFKYGANLNVVAPLADMLFGTKLDSSREALNNERRYWLCPNPVDMAKFERKERVVSDNYFLSTN